jgi:hypothetical protein
MCYTFILDILNEVFERFFDPYRAPVGDELI